MSFDILYNGLSKEMQMALIEQHDIGGLCCSFAMDWAKKRLVGKTIDESTYESVKRLKKIARRQKKGAPDAIAKSFGLKAGNRAVSILKESSEWTVRGEFGQAVYYISGSTGDDRHGFSIDTRNAVELRLADVGSGIYQVTDMTALQAVQEHLDLLEMKEGQAYPLSA